MVDDLPKLVADVNARIREIAERSAARTSDWEFMCECGDAQCQERVRLTLEAYEALLDGSSPVLAPGHTPSQHARSRSLREDARALRAQAEHQIARAKKSRKSPRT